MHPVTSGIYFFGYVDFPHTPRHAYSPTEKQRDIVNRRGLWGCGPHFDLINFNYLLFFCNAICIYVRVLSRVTPKLSTM